VQRDTGNRYTVPLWVSGSDRDPVMGAGPISLIVTPGFEHQQLLHHSSNDTIASFLTDVAKLLTADPVATTTATRNSLLGNPRIPRSAPTIVFAIGAERNARRDVVHQLSNEALSGEALTRVHSSRRGHTCCNFQTLSSSSGTNEKHIIHHQTYHHLHFSPMCVCTSKRRQMN